jgi:hypothetical protein
LRVSKRKHSLLLVPDGAQRSAFYHLKEYPPAPSISSIQSYLQRYHTVAATGIDDCEIQVLTPTFLDYFFKQAKRYSAKDLRRFADHKRYTLIWSMAWRSSGDNRLHTVSNSSTCTFEQT